MRALLAAIRLGAGTRPVGVRRSATSRSRHQLALVHVYPAPHTKRRRAMTMVWTRFNSVMLVLVFLALVSAIGMLATGAHGGALDPPGSPGSTMHTLDDSPVVWDRTLQANNGAP